VIIRINFKIAACIALVINFCLLAPVAKSDETTERRDTIRRIEDNTDRWIELQRRISDEQNQWETEQEMITSRLAVLRKEQDLLRENLDSYRLANELYEKNRLNVFRELDELLEASETVGKRLIEFESRVLTMAGSLPAQLRENLDPLFRQIDGAGKEQEEERSIADRSQTLIAVMSAIAQFGNTVNLTHTVRSSPLDGREFDVKVLYWGLAFAYAADAPGKRAWLLLPTADGWIWEDRSDQAKRFKALIDIYGKQREPELVTLPAELGP